MRKSIGAVLTFIGILLSIYGLVEKDSTKNQLSEMLGGITGQGGNNTPVVLIVAGVILAIGGIFTIFYKEGKV